MAFLQIERADGQGAGRIEIDTDEVTIGRSSTNTVPVSDPSASSRHCVIRREGRKFTLIDLNSTNGTLLNGEPLKESRLKPKDVITVGAVSILFDGDDVELDESTLIRPPVATIRAAPVSEPPSAFGARRSTLGIWLAVGAVVLIVLIALMHRFLSALFYK